MSDDRQELTGEDNTSSEPVENSKPATEATTTGDLPVELAVPLFPSSGVPDHSPEKCPASNLCAWHRPVLHLVICTKEHGSRYVDLSGPDPMCAWCRVQDGSQVSAQAEYVEERALIGDTHPFLKALAPRGLQYGVGYPRSELREPVMERNEFPAKAKFPAKVKRAEVEQPDMRLCCVSFYREPHAQSCPKLQMMAAVTNNDVLVGKTVSGSLPKAMDEVIMEAYLHSLRTLIDRCVVDADDPLATVLGVGIGAASMCWSNPDGAGVFDSQRASALIDLLKSWIEDYAISDGIPDGNKK